MRNGVGRMTKILVVGGKLIDLYADYDYAVGVGSGLAGDKRREYRQIAKFARATEKVVRKRPDMGKYERVGHNVGTGVGIAYAIATAPVTLLDSPLPGPADVAWAYSVMEFTDQAQSAGRYIGKQFD